MSDNIVKEGREIISQPLAETDGAKVFIRAKYLAELLNTIEELQKENERLLAGNNSKVIKQLHVNMKEMADEKFKQANKITKLEAVVDAAKELNDLEEDRLKGEYNFDSFTFQPLRIALLELGESDE